MAVDSRALIRGEVVRPRLLGVATELEPGVAEVEPVRVVPVIGQLGGRCIGGGSTLAGVHDECQSEHHDDRNDHREQRAALEAHLLALAGLGQLGGFLGGRRGGGHEDERLSATSAPSGVGHRRCSGHAPARRTPRRPLPGSPRGRPTGARVRPGDGRPADRSTRSRTAAMNASGSSGATATPPPEASRMAGTAVPGSIAATTGRPAAMIEYVFDGTLTRPSPARSGTTCTSPVASSSPSRASARCSRRSAGSRGREPDSSSDARAAPSPLIRNVTSGNARAAATTSSSDCEKPTLPAYSTTWPSPRPSSRR